jgi:hypothetical protein
MRIPLQLLNQACKAVEKEFGDSLPFKLRGIEINRSLIEAAMSVLNAAPRKTLPQNSLNDIRSRTPDGMDRRIKEYLDTNLRTANIISDVLAEADIVKDVTVINPATGRNVKGTRLLKEWCW